jgi:hypothetical protein
MYEQMTDNEVLVALGLERSSFSKRDDAKIDALIEILVKRGVYPKETVPGNPNTVRRMVDGWGAYWYKWDERKTVTICPHCQADMRDYKKGPPFLRNIGISDSSSAHTWECPDCHGHWRSRWSF